MRREFLFHFVSFPNLQSALRPCLLPATSSALAIPPLVPDEALGAALVLLQGVLPAEADLLQATTVW